MLKSIALAGFFFFASAVSAAPSAQPAPTKPAKITPPAAPAPHGFCPFPKPMC